MNGRETKNMREGITENQIRNAFLLQKKSNYGAIQSLASNANVYTFTKNEQSQYALNLSVSLVEAAAPTPENAEHASATYAPKRSF